MLWNTPKHHFGSSGLEWMLHKFGTPEIVHSKPKDEFLIFYVPKVSEMLQNTPKHHFGTNGLEWMLHNFWYPEIVHSGANTSFASFTYPRLANALKHSQTSFWVQWTRMDASQLWYPRNNAFWPKTQVLQVFTCRRLVKSSEILANIILGPMD
jgi:hypothetical protein